MATEWKGCGTIPPRAALRFESGLSIPALDELDVAMKMRTCAAAIISLHFAVVSTKAAGEEADSVFKSLGEALEEVVADRIESNIAGEHPAAFSVGVTDLLAIPIPPVKVTSLSPDLLARLAKRLPEVWANYVDLKQVKFVTSGHVEDPDGFLPRVPHDPKGKPIQFLEITGLAFVDDQTITVSWRCTGGSPSGVGGTKVVKRAGGAWELSSGGSYDFD